MPGRVTALVTLLTKLADLVAVLLKKRKEKRREAANEQLEDDPVGFFNDHFGGVSGKSSDAAKADKTDPGSDRD